MSKGIAQIQQKFMQKLTSNNKGGPKTTLEIVCIYVRPILLMSITFLAAATSAAAAAAAAATAAVAVAGEAGQGRLLHLSRPPRVAPRPILPHITSTVPRGAARLGSSRGRK